MTITYAEIKAGLIAAGYPTAPGAAWQGLDQQSFNERLIPDASYAAGVQPQRKLSNYGIAYPSVMPAQIATAIGNAAYTVTIAATPLSGVHPLSVTATATETNATATSYLWHWGDGTADTTTTVPTANHSYAAAGSFTVKMTPTVGGKAKAQVSAPAPVVVS